jgi:hypothetical protein
MHRASSQRLATRTPRPSCRRSLSPFLVDEIALTAAELHLARFRAPEAARVEP